jgi:hypothetical protein
MTQAKNRKQNVATDDLLERGYDEAVGLLERCLTRDGFLATNTDASNYRRIWGRDGCIISIAALLTGRDDLADGARRTLETLANHQGPHGEIPSNVDPETDRVSYGGTAGRVDADLWFLICCGLYWRRTSDEDFLNAMLERMQKTRFLLGAWEFNTRGLLYIPLTGDWADEYVHSGYVLYDQLLYLQAQRELSNVHCDLHGSCDHALEERIARLKHVIYDNYWFYDEDGAPDDVYHKVLYQRGRDAAPRRCGPYWMPFFAPTGYGYRFDAMANALVSLLGVADDEQRAAVDDFIDDQLVDDDRLLLPAFHPVITPRDEDWDELQMTFSHTFKNNPHEYHNGGRWPLVTGFYVADCAARGEMDRAWRFLEALHQANSMEMNGEPWSFPEFLHGEQYTPGGTGPLGWSAAAAIIAHHAAEGEEIFPTSTPDEAG